MGDLDALLRGLSADRGDGGTGRGHAALRADEAGRAGRSAHRRRPFAVVQLRQDNALGTLFNMVGFQTKLTYGEQKRIFRMIPGLERAEFARLGGVHRNTFINSPRLLDHQLRLKAMPHIRFAGQITGVEGYVESAAIGLLAGRFAAAEVTGEAIVAPPATTALGALLAHITRGAGCGDVSADERQLRPVSRRSSCRSRRPSASRPWRGARWPSSMPGWRGWPKRPRRSGDIMASNSDPSASANAAQAEYWNSAPAQTWIDCQAALDQRFAPLTELLIGRADVRAGECVIDVGCGTGATTARLAAVVGAHGSVLAIDISEPLLAVARRRCLEGGHANVRLIRGDAQTHRFERGCHDLVISRFGVMFFDDPVGAFRQPGRRAAPARPPRVRLLGTARGESLVRAAAPGGHRAARPAGTAAAPRARPARAQRAGLHRRDPERGRVRDVLIERTETWLPGAPSAREEAELAGQVGLLARLLREREADEATRADLIGELTGRLAPYLTADGVRLPATIHLVTATAPG